MPDLIGQNLYKDRVRQMEATDPAVPNTWNPIHQDLINNDVALKTLVDGKAAATHTHTAAEVGASPTGHTHTAADVGASPVGHTHAEDVKTSGGTMTGALTLYADPTQALHAATKQYVDAIKQGLDVKDSVRVATSANLNLAVGGLLTVDGVALAAGDRVLVKDQALATENGIYVAAAGAWNRAADADSSQEVTPGIYVFVEEGTTNADSGWVLTTNGPITLGTTPLTFTQFSGAGQIVAGTGLQKSGNTLSLAPGAAAGNLGYTPVNKAGDTMSGPLVVQGEDVATGIRTARMRAMFL